MTEVSDLKKLRAIISVTVRHPTAGVNGNEDIGSVIGTFVADVEAGDTLDIAAQYRTHMTRSLGKAIAQASERFPGYGYVCFSMIDDNFPEVALPISGA